jgi:hypothetical protein
MGNKGSFCDCGPPTSMDRLKMYDRDLYEDFLENPASKDNPYKKE